MSGSGLALGVRLMQEWELEVGGVPFIENKKDFSIVQVRLIELKRFENFITCFGKILIPS